MINKLKIEISDGKDIKLCNLKLSPLMKKYVNKLWSEYYSLFNLHLHDIYVITL